MIFLDTSGLFAYLHRREPQHAEAVRQIAGSSGRLVHNYVLAELIAVASVRGAARDPVLRFLEALRSGRSLAEVVFVDDTLHDAGVDLLRQRPAKAWSLCDAVSFVLMQRSGVTEDLTTDHHFE